LTDGAISTPKAHLSRATAALGRGPGRMALLYQGCGPHKAEKSIRTSDLEEWISGGLVANRMVNRVLRPSAVDRENPAFAGFSVRRI